MKKADLIAAVQAVKTETKEALQTMYDDEKESSGLLTEDEE